MTKQSKGWEERLLDLFVEDENHHLHLVDGSQTLMNFIQSELEKARAEARDKGFEEGARKQAMLDVNAVREARAEAIQEVENCLPNKLPETGIDEFEYGLSNGFNQALYVCRQAIESLKTKK